MSTPTVKEFKGLHNSGDVGWPLPSNEGEGTHTSHKVHAGHSGGGGEGQEGAHGSPCLLLKERGFEKWVCRGHLEGLMAT